MVVGIDVYHDAGKGGKSIAGLVASTNKQFTRWYSRVCKQQPGQELIDSLKVSFADALKKYHEVLKVFYITCNYAIYLKYTRNLQIFPRIINRPKIRFCDPAFLNPVQTGMIWCHFMQ